MADEFADVSTDELLKRYQAARAPVGTSSAAAATEQADPVSAMSTEDLMRQYKAQKYAKENPEDVTAGMALRGIPVLGAYIPQAEAAIRAAAQPLTGVGKPGATWSERYAANLPEREAQYAQAEQESPVTSEALKIGGGAAALAPLGATAAGGRLLGTTGGLASRLGFGAASGAGLSAADVAARGGSVEDAATAAKWGAGVGAAAPVVAGAASKLISPFVSSDPTRRAAAQVLRQEGVEPSAGQATGSKLLQWGEQHLGELGGISPGERTAERFTSAALRRTGENATRATPEVVDRAFTRIGQQFDDLAARNVLQPDRGMGGQIRQAVAEYDRMIAPPNRSPALAQYEQEIANALASNRNTIPGDIYQSLRSRIEADARGTSDRFLAGALRDMRSALDDAMERHLQRIKSPDAGAWRQARNQYRNLLVVERAITSPGANAQLGLISPAALYNATRNVQGRRNIARGFGDFADLAQSGSAILRDLPSSGTAQRMFVQGAFPAIGAAYGGLSGQDQGAALWGAGAGLLAGPLAGRAIMSRPAQRYLGNQLLAGPSGQAFRGGVTGGLLSMMQ
jgi:hypothetical protein